MTLHFVLAEAQRLLAGDAKNGPGWTGPEHALGYCKRKCGENALGLPMLELCEWNDEAAWQFTVEGALRLAARNDGALVLAAWEAVREVVAPLRAEADRQFSALPPPSRETWSQHYLAHTVALCSFKQLDLGDWLQVSERKLGEVLAAFDVAVLKARTLDA